MLERQGIKMYIISYGVYLIALLWFYAAVSKLIAYEHFYAAMQKQPFPVQIQKALVYLLPGIELLIGTGLLSIKFRRVSLLLSAVLFLLFSAYISMILLKAFGHIPCSCGGLVERMGWKFHLWFNISFLALNLYIIITEKRKERFGKQ